MSAARDSRWFKGMITPNHQPPSEQAPCQRPRIYNPSQASLTATSDGPPALPGVLLQPGLTGLKALCPALSGLVQRVAHQHRRGAPRWAPGFRVCTGLLGQCLMCSERCRTLAPHLP
ncbi:hypothetical protein HaLaN_30153 [Haematococcus lacustris]|uniref:Uncharacterized protein n=1 Tax=Haematococcus lacustris TaxID=44745 RepID=A0A6A0AE53_HAELA|nr:hypothetical protein HaLaN_30153 [Haematococcus lacustris]